MVTLVSKLSHPRRIKYDEEFIVVPPHGKYPNIDESKLGELPRGIYKIKQQKDKPISKPVNKQPITTKKEE
jgi:hypothetical protein